MLDLIQSIQHFNYIQVKLEKMSQIVKKDEQSSKVMKKNEQSQYLSESAQLYQYKTAYTQLEHSFKNNIHVIKQLEQENQLLIAQLTSLKQQYDSKLQHSLAKQKQIHQQKIQALEMSYAREIDLIKKQYEQIIMGLQDKINKDNQQNLTAISKKYNKQITNLNNSHQEQIAKFISQIENLNKKNNNLQKSNAFFQQKCNQQKIQIISFQNKIQELKLQKQSSYQIYQNYQSQLSSITKSSTQWEQKLKQKIKEIQKQKNKLQEQLNEEKMLSKQRQRKLKQESIKKINSLQEEKQCQMREVMREVKEIKHKHQTIKDQNRQLKQQIQNIKSQKTKLIEEVQMQNQKINGLLAFQSKEKQFYYQLKINQNQHKHLKNQIEELTLQLNSQKSEFLQINQKRQIAEKALERLKVQLINKAKEIQQIKKTNAKLTYQLKQNQQFIPTQTVNLNSLDRYQQKDSIKYEQKDLIKGEVDYSRCFTQDMGPIDQKFFMMESQMANKQANIQSQSPKNNIQSLSRIHPNVLKRIGQLQLQNNEYKSTIHRLKQEMENTKVRVQQKYDLKERQIKILEKESLSLRQRINDKQAQILTLKQSLSALKQQIQSSKQKIIQLNKSQQNISLRQVKNQSLKNQNIQLKSKIQKLQVQLKNVIAERDMLQDISGDLRAQLNQIKNQYEIEVEDQGYESEQNYSAHHHAFQQNIVFPEQDQNKFLIRQKQKPLIQTNKSNLSKKQQNNRKYPIKGSSININKANNEKQEQKRSTIPRKLHELIKQKKQLQIAGQKAHLQQKQHQLNVYHSGTQSQKQILQRIKQKSAQKYKRLEQKKINYNQFARKQQQKLNEV